MNTKHTFLSAGLLAAVVAFPAMADVAQPVRSATDRPEKGHEQWLKRTDANRRPALGPITRAADLIGREVRNKQNEKLGKVEDLAIDTGSGRIAQVLVSSGGFIGIGDKLTAVPPSALVSTGDKEPLWLDVDREQFKNAPRFDVERWHESTGSGRVVETYRYFKTEPYFVVVQEAPASSGAHHEKLGHLVRASEVVGMTVKNPAGETLGEVKDLLLDYQGGRVNQVLMSAGGFLGVGDELSVVPPGAFRYSAENENLVLDVTKETLTSAPRYQAGKWATAQETPFIAKVYSAFGVEPYFDPSAPIVWHAPDNTGRNREMSKTAQDQGNGAEDIRIARDIRRAILAKDEFSMNAQNVKIIAEDGKVTLKGPVNSQWEKTAIEDLAAAVVDRSKITNQLEVKPTVASR